MSAWQFTTFYIGIKLKKSFGKRRENLPVEESTLNEIPNKLTETGKLLNEGNFENIVPVSVTENTTKNLVEIVKVNSSQSEH